MDPDDGSADPLGENASRTTQDPPAEDGSFVTVPTEAEAGDGEGSQRSYLAGLHGGAEAHGVDTAQQSPRADTHNLCDTSGDDCRNGGRSAGEFDGIDIHGDSPGDDATLVSLATMDTATFRRLRKLRRNERYARGISGDASDSTEQTRNDGRRHRECGEKGASRRRRRAGNDDASFNSHSRHGNRSASPNCRSSRRSKRSRASSLTSLLIGTPWQALLLFTMGFILMAKMGVVELRLERSEGRFLRGGEGIAEEGGRKYPPAAVRNAEEAGGTRDADDGGELADAPRANEEEGGAGHPKANPTPAEEGADGKDPPSERYFRKAVEELIGRTDTRGNGDDDSLASEGRQPQSEQQPQQEEDVGLEALTPEQEQLLLARDAQARQERAKQEQARQIEEQMLWQRQQLGGHVREGASLDPSPRVASEQGISKADTAGGLAGWQAQGQGVQPQTQLQALTANGGSGAAPVPKITEQLRNLPLFPQARSQGLREEARQPPPLQAQQTQQQQKPYQYVQQQVPVAGNQLPVPAGSNVIVGQQAHLRGDSSQFAVVGGSFIHAVDADGTVVNDPNAPANAQEGLGVSAPAANANAQIVPGEVDVLSDDPFHNDSRNFRQEAPLHLFTPEEREKLAALEKEEAQQQLQPQTAGSPKDTVAHAEKPAAPPKRSVEDGIADDNPRLWGAK